ncbi:unnamed protein product [Cercopithifilaria johnstoni]|uniref:Uncharacterized protein n=1 Tax=Cercopithifilaria johnstoni TaxID=2874296 RepID=A0A8J2PUQ2_9BILA|nr:unnamed protein product [Cercopithifilaria johnstoni]
MATTALKNIDKVQSRSKSKMKESKKPLSRSILKFAVEKGQPDVARLKLLLCNNSSHQMEWILKCTDNAITAEPVKSGHIEKLGSSEVNLMWQRPKAIKKWTDAPQPKMKLFLKLIAIKTNKEIADAFTKFKAMINPEAECTVDDLPVHEIIFKSEVISEQSATDESNFKNVVDNATTDPENFLENPDTLYWLIVLLCCFLGAIILESISNDDRHSRRHISNY